MSILHFLAEPLFMRETTLLQGGQLGGAVPHSIKYVTEAVLVDGV